MGKLLNLARMTSPTTGTGAIIGLGAAVTGFLSLTAAGALNGDVLSYAIRDGTQSEVGTATYSSAGPSLTGRTPIASTNGGAAINLSGAAEIVITPNAIDLGNVAGPASATDNAVARYDSTTGKSIQNSGVIIDDSNQISGVQKLTITPPALSTTQAIVITQSSPTSGSALGDFHYNEITITDAWDIGDSTLYETDGWIQTFNTGGANSKGQKIAFSVTINHNSASNDPVVRDHLCGRFTSWASASEGGTDTGSGSKGTAYALDLGARLFSGATNYNVVSCIEARTQINTGGSCRNRLGISSVSGGEVQAANIDCGFEISGLPGTPGFKHGIILTALHGTAGLATTGTVFGTDATAQTVANGIDWSLLTITGSFLKSANFEVAGNGNITKCAKAIIGTSADPNLGVTPATLVAAADASIWQPLSLLAYNASTFGATMAVGSTRSPTSTGHTALQLNDTVGTLAFFADDGANYRYAGGVVCVIDGTVAASDTPGRLVFQVRKKSVGSIDALTILNSGVIGIGKSPTHLLDLAAGTATIAPLALTSGTNLTTAAAGAFEYDGKCIYGTTVASSRQVIDAEQVQVLSANRTLTNNTSAQAIFNATANGALTVAAATTYEFEAVIAATGFSASAHTLNFGFGGTATFTGIHYKFVAQTGSTLATPTAVSSGWIAAATASAICASTTTTGLLLFIKGVMRINAGGTIIPQLTQVTASAAAVVQTDSFFRCWPIGSNTVTSVGNWS